MERDVIEALAADARPGAVRQDAFHAPFMQHQTREADDVEARAEAGADPRQVGDTAVEAVISFEILDVQLQTPTRPRHAVRRQATARLRALFRLISATLDKPDFTFA
ncbi:hypothetical protein [Methylobacterium sp. WL6]|uniref:hypothetical protein n=1 Tax=Methylobacterium sp. WL6 TaxID=2603901 RepID=UPI001FEE4D8F|nr:hypothetical protein [Methylobacterium sp. WL6]